MHISQNVKIFPKNGEKKSDKKLLQSINLSNNSTCLFFSPRSHVYRYFTSSFCSRQSVLRCNLRLNVGPNTSAADGWCCIWWAVSAEVCFIYRHAPVIPSREINTSRARLDRGQYRESTAGSYIQHCCGAERPVLSRVNVSSLWSV